MKSVLGANEKPNCLVIDEIDGAPMVRESWLIYQSVLLYSAVSDVRELDLFCEAL